MKHFVTNTVLCKNRAILSAPPFIPLNIHGKQIVSSQFSEKRLRSALEQNCANDQIAIKSTGEMKKAGNDDELDIRLERKQQLEML